jgi:hypothetical protein
MVYVTVDEADFRSISFLRRFAEVGVEGVKESGFAGCNGGLETAELVLPVSQWAGGAGLEILALPGDEGRDVHIW